MPQHLKLFICSLLTLALFACGNSGNKGEFIPGNPGSAIDTGGGTGTGGGGGGGGGGGAGGATLTLTGTSPLTSSTETDVVFTIAGTSLSDASAVSIQQVDATFFLLATAIPLNINSTSSTQVVATLPADSTLPTGSYVFNVDFPGGTRLVSSFVVSLYNFTVNFRNATDGVFAGSTGGAGTLTPRPNSLAAGLVNNDTVTDLVIGGGDDMNNLVTLYYGSSATAGVFTIPTDPGIASINGADGFSQVALEPAPTGGNAPNAVVIGTEEPEVQFLATTGAGAGAGFVVAPAASRFVVDTLVGVGATGNIPTAILYNNFDGDTSPDLVIAVGGTPSDGMHKVLLLQDGGNADFPFESMSADIDVISLGGLTSPLGMASGNFDGTGADSRDVVVINGNSTMTVILFDAMGVASVQTPITLAGIPTGVGAGDFDGDGNMDIAVSSIGTTSSQAQVFFGDGSGNFTQSGPTLTSLTGTLNSLAVADLNADGYADIVMGASSGNMEIYFSSFESISGSDAFNRTSLSMSDVGTEVFLDVITADFSGDTKADIALAASVPVGVGGVTDVFIAINR